MIRSSGLLDRVNGLNHAFFTRFGGVSTGVYRSLNCGHGSGDQRVAVIENRRRAMKRIGLPPNMLMTCNQVHGTHVAYAKTTNKGVEADGLVTDQPGLAIGVLTADCAPVIFADVNSSVVGVVHAGWRGALAGVIDAGVESMVKLGAQAKFIRAAIGPCIGAKSYEVGPEFVRRFTKHDPCYEQFFKPASRLKHSLFDLSGFVEMRIKACGIERIDCCSVDSYAEEQHFFSFRRSQHLGEADYGRALSVVVLE